MKTPKQGKLQTKEVLKAYSKASFKYPWYVVLAIIGAIGVEVTNVIAPLYMRQFINILSTNTPSPEVTTSLLWALGLMSGYKFLTWVFQRIRMTTISTMESWVMRDLSNDAFKNLLGHSHEFFISNFAGALTRRVSRYARSYEQVFDSFILTFFPTLLFAAGTIVVLYLQSPYLGIGLFVWVISFFVLQYFLTRWRQQYKLIRSLEDSKVTGILSDTVANHSTIALFATTKSETSYLAQALQRWTTANLKSWSADNIVYSIQGLLSVVTELALLITGVYLWNKGQLTIGDFVLIQVYIFGLMNRVWDVGHTMRRLNDAFADASEMIDIIQKPYDVADTTHAQPLHVSAGQIEYAATTFNFGAVSSILSDFNLQVRAGEKIALVGPSGAGKSTITKLLLRMYDVTDGAITIDEQNIADVTQESLRRAIGYVPQEAILFHRTLRDNIAYGKQDATDEEIIEASKKAHCHEFISTLPEGYDTFVGERGVKLSGGERQRIAIARAILKNAPILVLDEATASLDSQSEHLIQEALAVLMEGKTVIVIAHRLSTIMKMDRIIVMEHGTIVAQGTHEELLKERGLYAKLWSIQAGAFLAEDKIPEGVEEEIP